MGEMLGTLGGVALGLFYVFGVPALAIFALVVSRRLDRKVGELESEVKGLRASLAAADTPAARSDPSALPSRRDTDEAAQVQPSPPEPGPEEISADTAETPAPDEPVRPAWTGRAPREKRPRRNWDEAFATNWLIWVGALALALGGGFLVKFSIDQGLLSPSVRVLLAGLAGLAMLAAGEWLKRRPEDHPVRQRGDRMPAALVAAGLATLFAAGYAAEALYGLLPALPAFAFLAAVSFGAALAALRYGRWISTLGVVGGYAVPFLIQTDHPQAIGLFAYLFFVAAAGTAIVRHFAMPVLAVQAVAGALLWPLLWFAGPFQPSDSPVMATYLVALGALFALVPFPPHPETAAPGRAVRRLPMPGNLAEAILMAAALGCGLIAILLARHSGYDTEALAGLGALGLLYGLVARTHPRLDLLAVLGAALVLGGLISWVPETLETEFPPVREPLLPPDLDRYALVLGTTALAFAALGFSGLWGAVRPWLWAALSVVVPLLLFLAAYARIGAVPNTLAWGLCALTIAAAAIVAAALVRSHTAHPGYRWALGLYAVAAAAAIATGASILLERTWLTIALAVMVPIVAGIDRRLKVPGLAPTAMVLSLAVLVRLVFNADLRDGSFEGWERLFNWLLYGYGVPALCFWLAARLFGRPGTGWAATALRIAAAAVALGLVSLEIRMLLGEGQPVWRGGYGLLEQSLNSLVWLLAALALLWRLGELRLARLGCWFLLALAIAQILGLQGGLSSPLLTGEPVGVYPLANVLLPAYLAPALLLLPLAELAAGRGVRPLRPWLESLAFLLGFWWLTLSLRQVFHGSVLAGPFPEGLELYGYSVLWIALAAVALVLGLARGLATLRNLAFGLAMLATLKVFLVDMAGLEGFLRAVSFLGLGGALVGLSYLYRVLSPRRATPSST